MRLSDLLAQLSDCCCLLFAGFSVFLGLRGRIFDLLREHFLARNRFGKFFPLEFEFRLGLPRTGCLTVSLILVLNRVSNNSGVETSTPPAVGSSGACSAMVLPTVQVHLYYTTNV